MIGNTEITVCTCACHGNSNMMHIISCCGPGSSNPNARAPTTATLPFYRASASRPEGYELVVPALEDAGTDPSTVVPWQPIATAPVDGVVILGCDADEDVFTCKCTIRHARLQWVLAVSGCSDYPGAGVDPEVFPRYWMPCPKPYKVQV
jgi:hypothetical protein